jgi:hypothetical protein
METAFDDITEKQQTCLYLAGIYIVLSYLTHHVHVVRAFDAECNAMILVWLGKAVPYNHQTIK